VSIQHVLGKDSKELFDSFEYQSTLAKLVILENGHKTVLLFPVWPQYHCGYIFQFSSVLFVLKFK